MPLLQVTVFTTTISLFMNHGTAKILKIRTPEKIAVIMLKLEQNCFTTKDSDRKANSVDPAQFAQACLSKT